jgi:hypothetical protein
MILEFRFPPSIQLVFIGINLASGLALHAVNREPIFILPADACANAQVEIVRDLLPGGKDVMVVRVFSHICTSHYNR